MKYLLVAQSLKKYTDLEEYCMPLGIAYINGAMRSCGFDVDAINMLFEDDPLEALRSRIMDKKIDVLMCGGLTSEYKVLKQIYSIAREANPNIIIVGGGGGFTSEPILFSEMTGVDYAVIGEGEVTNCELAYALDFDEDVSGIKGLVYCAEDGYHQNEAREYVKDLDSLPFPSYEGLSMDKYLDCPDGSIDWDITSFNKQEVAELKWVTIEELKKWIEINPNNFTTWFRPAFELAYNTLCTQARKKNLFLDNYM